MKVEVGIVEVLDSRLAVAFVDNSYIGSGADAELFRQILMRLEYLTCAPLMLYSTDGRGYAPFQTHEFTKRIRREHAVAWFEVDLNKPFYEYEGEPVF